MYSFRSFLRLALTDDKSVSDLPKGSSNSRNVQR